MNENTVINQKQGIGNQGTQIGVLNNIYGLSAPEAMQMAFAIFREYYPQLREEAINELKILVEEKLNCLPSDCIVSPSPRIAVPTLQNASITEEYEVRELYASLLANSMNRQVCNAVHPCYVEIIKQLSQDDAKLLNYMYHNSIVPTISMRFSLGEGASGKVLNDFTDVPESLGCMNSDNVEVCFNNLVRLGLVSKHYSGLKFPDKVVKQLKSHPTVQAKYREARETMEKLECFSKLNEYIGYIMLTDFGRDFCRVCVIDKKEEVHP